MKTSCFLAYIKDYAHFVFVHLSICVSRIPLSFRHLEWLVVLQVGVVCEFDNDGEIEG